MAKPLSDEMRTFLENLRDTPPADRAEAIAEALSDTPFALARAAEVAERMAHLPNEDEKELMHSAMMANFALELARAHALVSAICQPGVIEEAARDLAEITKENPGARAHVRKSARFMSEEDAVLLDAEKKKKKPQGSGAPGPSKDFTFTLTDKDLSGIPWGKRPYAMGAADEDLSEEHPEDDMDLITCAEFLRSLGNDAFIPLEV